LSVLQTGTPGWPIGIGAGIVPVVAQRVGENIDGEGRRAVTNDAIGCCHGCRRGEEASAEPAVRHGQWGVRVALPTRAWDPDVVERAHRVCLGDGRGQVRVDAERLVRGHVGARRVLHAAEAALLPNARRVPLILEVVVSAGGKVEGGDPAREAGVVLQAAVRRRRLIAALHLGDLDLPLAARRRVRAQEVEVDRRRVRRGGAKIDVN